MSILDVEFFEEPSAPDSVKKALNRQRLHALERREACEFAAPALARLVEIFKHRSGQPYKLRSLLYSLWNGKPTSLVEIVGLDWEIRKDLGLVLIAFGYEDKQTKFFYRAIEEAIKAAGQWEWFLEERRNVQQLKEYVESAEREEADR